MGTAAAVARVTHLPWSRWFHCESSFDLSLVPEEPGIFAVGQEDAGKKLAIVNIEAADDLFHALNQLFSANCPLRAQLEKGRCMMRYASVPDADQRRAALTELQSWLAAPGGAKTAVVEDFLSNGTESHPFRGKSD